MQKNEKKPFNIETYYPSIDEFSHAVGLHNDEYKYDKIDAFGWLLGKIKTKNIFYYLKNKDALLDKFLTGLVEHGFITEKEKDEFKCNQQSYEDAVKEANKIKAEPSNR